MTKETRRTPLSLVLVALFLPTLGLPVAAQNPKSPEPIAAGELTNPLLSPSYAQWLVGPVSWMLSDKERDEYLFLSSDEKAEQFIADFWKKNASVKELFEERAEEAEKKFRELTYRGDRSDRGTVYVLYGPPSKERYEEHRNVLDGDIELWEYEKNSPKGLDGRKPLKAYRFIKDGDKTIFYKTDRRRDAQRRFEDQRRLPTRPPF